MYQPQNGLRDLTNEQRKALVQCLKIRIRPGLILAGTRFVLPTEDNTLTLNAEAGEAYGDLLREGFDVNPVNGEIVAIPILDRISMGIQPGRIAGEAAPVVSPFTPDQERRIKDIISSELVRFVQELRDFLS